MEDKTRISAYYNSEIDAWMRTGSNRTYESEEAAKKAAQKAENARRRYYTERAKSIFIKYSDIYNKVVSAADISYDDNGSAGKGFYDLWSPIWYNSDYMNSGYTLYEIYLMKDTFDDPAAVNALLERIRVLSTDASTRNTLTLLLNYPDE